LKRLELNSTRENSWETRQKPFDVLAEGLSVSSSRGNKTPLELFLAVLHACDRITLNRLFDAIR
jgi:hypothetical protein